MRHSTQPPGGGILLLALVGLALPLPAGATSKTAVALIADPAPTGGLFAGPGLAGWPSAAGSGWVAFRGALTGSDSREAMVVSHLTAPTSSAQVATTGQAVRGEGPVAGCTGKLKQFLSRPVVNARGDLAFLALVTPEVVEEPSPDDVGLPPTPAGIFLYRGGQLRPVACTGQATPLGRLDLVQQTNLLLEATIAENPPAIDDAGNVAFLSGLLDDRNLERDPAVFVVPNGGVPQAAIQVGATTDWGELLTVGPPAMNNRQALAFHVTIGDDAGFLDGILLADGGTLALVARDGITPAPLDPELPLVEFHDPVTLNDRGDVAFLAGPIFDLSENASLDDEGAPGVLVASDGAITLVGYPGQEIGPDRVTTTFLGSAAGGSLPAPSLTPDGRLVFFVSLNGGSAEAIVGWAPGLDQPTPIVYTAGTSDPTPAGGTYGAARSAPAADALGGVAFYARITGGTTSEALIYRNADGAQSATVVGDAPPGPPRAGFFAGPPFSTPILNDRGDVVFRAFVARGPTSVGIFRARDGVLETLVAAGAPSPNPGAPRFLDIVGDPSLSSSGAIAFAATVSGLGRGIYAADGGSVRAIAVRGDPAPGTPGTTFATVGTNPAINGRGDVAFRATTAYRDGLTGLTEKREGLFLSDATGIQVLAYAGDPTSEGIPFLRLRDPIITDLPSVAFRASLGIVTETSSGVFLASPGSVARVVVRGDQLGGGISVLGFNGEPAASPTGTLAFAVTRARPFEAGNPLLEPLGPALLRATAGGIETVTVRGDHATTGGRFRSLGPPSVNAAGHVAFRGSFFPGSGGTAGVYLATEGGIRPHLLVREGSPGTGRFNSLRARVSINANDEIAFGASYVSRRESANGIFVASPSTLQVQRLSVSLAGGGRKDRIRVRARLHPGRFFDGFQPAREPVTVALYDANGLVWQANVPDRRLERAGKSFGIVVARGTELGAQLRSLRVRINRKSGDAIVSAVSAKLPDLTSGGFRDLTAPLTVNVQVGGDSGFAQLDCNVGPRGAQCGG